MNLQNTFSGIVFTSPDLSFHRSMTRTDEVAAVEAPMHEIINFFICKKNPDFNIFLNMISLHNATLTYPNSPLLIS